MTASKSIRYIGQLAEVVCPWIGRVVRPGEIVQVPASAALSAVWEEVPPVTASAAKPEGVRGGNGK